MRGKDFNTGLRGGLLDVRHYKRMGAALWLYGWLVLRQTSQSADVGLVLGGKPVSYREIEEETGFARKTLERWMHILRQKGYVETIAAPAGVVVKIMKAKKFKGAEGARFGRPSNLEWGRKKQHLRVPKPLGDGSSIPRGEAARLRSPVRGCGERMAGKWREVRRMRK